MQTVPPRSALTRVLMVAVALLLCLSPFLHSHMGGSHVTGFHLDGVDAATHPTSALYDSVHAQGDEESPAIGVSTSLSKSEKDGEFKLAVLFLTLSSGLALKTPTESEGLRPTDLAAVRPLPGRTEGSPPPAHAPPLTHA